MGQQSSQPSTRPYGCRELLEVLNRPDLPDIITTKWIGAQVGAPWRLWGKDVLKRAETQGCLRTLGWRYEPARGPSGGKFVRDTTTTISELISTALQRSRGSQERFDELKRPEEENHQPINLPINLPNKSSTNTSSLVSETISQRPLQWCLKQPKPLQRFTVPT